MANRTIKGKQVTNFSERCVEISKLKSGDLFSIDYENVCICLRVKDIQHGISDFEYYDVAWQRIIKMQISTSYKVRLLWTDEYWNR